MSSRIPDLLVGLRDCERSVYGKFTAEQIRLACDRGEIDFEREGKGKRRVNFKSFCVWVKKREKEIAAETRAEKAKLEARQNG